MVDVTCDEVLVGFHAVAYPGGGWRVSLGFGPLVISFGSCDIGEGGY